MKSKCVNTICILWKPCKLLKDSYWQASGENGQPLQQTVEDRGMSSDSENESTLGFPGGAVVEGLPANAGDTGSSPGLGRSHMPRSN